MAERADRTAGGDQGPKEEQLPIHQPLGDVEMEDLSSTQPKPANPDASPSLPSLPPPAHGSDVEPAAASGTTQDTPSTSVEPSAKAQGKAPVTTATTENEDLTIDPVEPPTGPGASDGDIAVEIMLLLTTGARHPFRIDEKYLTKRNVTVTGKTEDGEMDPSSITVYTLKELILRDWRKEWDQPPREPSAIRLIHFGRMLEDRMPLNHYQFSNTSRNVVHMTVKPQDIIDEEEAAKKVKDSSHSGGRSGCCVIL